MGLVRQVRGDHDRFRRGVEPALDPLETKHAADLGNVEVAVVKGDAVRPVQVGADAKAVVGLAVPVRVQDCVNDSAAPASGTDEDGSGRTLGQRASVVEFCGEDVDREAGRQFDLVQAEFLVVGESAGANRRQDGEESGQTGQGEAGVASESGPRHGGFSFGSMA